MTASAENRPPDEHRPDERRKMTVSERNIGTLAADLRGWLAGRLGHPGELTVSGAAEPMEGFWWLYAPLQFESFALIVILQENPDGYRTLSNAKRVWPDGRVEQLGWPRAEIKYAPGTRQPSAARIYLTDGTGKPVCVEIEILTSLPLHVGAGYNGDPDWTHGRWMGPELEQHQRL